MYISEGGGGPLDGVGSKNHIKVITLTTFRTEYRIQKTKYNCSKTHVHKITSVPVFYVALGLERFFSRAIGKGVDSRLTGREMATSEASAI
jgi:hypothetical protein